jgi:hypothetical protein
VPVEPEQVARELDDWVLRHREPLDPINGSTPVTDSIQRMHPALELMHLHAQRALLNHTGAHPPATILAAIAEREALVHDALATGSHNPPPEQADGCAAGEGSNQRADGSHIRWSESCSGVHPACSAAGQDARP